MAIQSADITYTVTQSQRSHAGGGRYRTPGTVSWPSGLTYDTGGVPLVKGNLGCPISLEQLTIMDNGAASADMYRYDVSAEKIKIFAPQLATSDLGNPPTSGNFSELATGDTILSATLDVVAIGF